MCPIEEGDLYTQRSGAKPEPMPDFPRRHPVVVVFHAEPGRLLGGRHLRPEGGQQVAPDEVLVGAVLLAELLDQRWWAQPPASQPWSCRNLQPTPKDGGFAFLSFGIFAVFIVLLSVYFFRQTREKIRTEARVSLM